MFKTFEVARHRKTRVWLDEAPYAEFAPEGVRTRLLAPELIVPATRRIAAVELFRPHGGSFSYALLGAEVTPMRVRGLEVEVLVGGQHVPYPLALASKVDAVTFGLTQEFVGAVFDGVAHVADVRGAPTEAALRFRWAAQGPVGSSERVFTAASMIVTRLLTLSSSDDREIEELLDTAFAATKRK